MHVAIAIEQFGHIKLFLKFLHLSGLVLTNYFQVIFSLILTRYEFNILAVFHLLTIRVKKQRG
jgi:hypothetical protein